MSDNPRDQALEIDLVDGRLVMSIGVDALLNGILDAPALDSGELVVTDREAFMAAIVKELEVDEDDGTTLIHRALDQAAENAIESGCDGIDDAPADIEQEDD